MVDHARFGRANAAARSRPKFPPGSRWPAKRRAARGRKSGLAPDESTLVAHLRHKAPPRGATAHHAGNLAMPLALSSPGCRKPPEWSRREHSACAEAPPDPQMYARQAGSLPRSPARDLLLTVSGNIRPHPASLATTSPCGRLRADAGDSSRAGTSVVQVERRQLAILETASPDRAAARRAPGQQLAPGD